MRTRVAPSMCSCQYHGQTVHTRVLFIFIFIFLVTRFVHCPFHFLCYELPPLLANILLPFPAFPLLRLPSPPSPFIHLPSFLSPKTAIESRPFETLLCPFPSPLFSFRPSPPFPSPLFICPVCPSIPCIIHPFTLCILFVVPLFLVKSGWTTFSLAISCHPWPLPFLFLLYPICASLSLAHLHFRPFLSSSTLRCDP